MALLGAEVPLDKIIRCPSDTAVNSQLSISAKRQALLALHLTWCLNITEDGSFAVIHRGEAKKDDIKVDLGQLFRSANAQVYSEHRDWVLILSGLGISPGRDS